MREAFARRLRILEEQDPSALAKRISPDVWSALEYVCHVRDVLLAQRERLYLALIADCPSFAPIFGQRRAELAHYGSERPAELSTQLDSALAMTAWAYANLEPEAWARQCVYNFPEPAKRNIAWFGAHTLHEVAHHLGDIDRQLPQ